MGTIKKRGSERIQFLNVHSEAHELFDLSTTGACCRCDQRLAADDIVKVRVKDLVLRARVAYCIERTDGFRVGMEFLEVTSEQKVRLREIVDRYSRGVPVSFTVVGLSKGAS